MFAHFNLRLLALAAVAFVATSCAPKYPKCDSDAQCKAKGEVCVQGACQECGRDDDCKSGFVCQENRCVPKPECVADADCGPGGKCRDNRCQAECASAADCAAGLECKNGRCLGPEACLGDADCAAGQRCQANRCIAADGACVLPTIQFGYNDYALTGEAQRLLDTTAQCLQSGKIGRGTVTLSGHADERGTEEFNLHLGERRANAVKRYLVLLGVDASTLRTISYGEERPIDPGHDEGAWMRNRRVEVTQ